MRIKDSIEFIPAFAFTFLYAMPDEFINSYY